ncbi:hypothetical protein M1E11_16735 [Bacillus sp. JZ8]
MEYLDEIKKYEQELLAKGPISEGELVQEVKEFKLQLQRSKVELVQ